MGSSYDVDTNKKKEETKSFFLVPEFDQSIPAGRSNLGSFVRMPHDGAADGLVSLPSRQDPRGLPIPDEHFPVGVSRNDITRRKTGKYC